MKSVSRPASAARSQGWKECKDLADAFAAECEKAGPKVDQIGKETWEEFLPAEGSPERRDVLEKQIKAHLQVCWRHGRAVHVEHYLKRFPELGTADTVSPHLILEEFLARQRFHATPALSEYETRFPARSAEVALLVEQQLPLATLATPSETPGSMFFGPGRVDADDPAGSLRSAAPAPPTRSMPPLTEVTAVPEPRRSDPARPDTASVSSSRSGGTGLSSSGGYRLGKRLGGGQFGEVWRAEAPGGVEVAVKIISRPITHDDIQRELQALERIKNLRHVFLLQTFAFWEQDERLFIVTELADGTLRDKLKECKAKGLEAVPVDELLTYFGSAAEGIDFLHANKLQHRDIKPENILFLGRYIKVGDFGLARSTQSVASQTGASGTPAYMAPEVWRNQVAMQSDQYSLAVTYAELRLGRRPFRGTSFADVMQDHLYNKPDLGPLSKAEQKVLLKALAKEPEKRYRTCVEFAKALREAVHPSASERRPLSKLLVAALLLLVVVLGGLGAVGLPTVVGYFSPERGLRLKVDGQIRNAQFVEAREELNKAAENVVPQEVRRELSAKILNAWVDSAKKLLREGNNREAVATFEAAAGAYPEAQLPDLYPEWHQAKVRYRLDERQYAEAYDAMKEAKVGTDLKEELRREIRDAWLSSARAKAAPGKYKDVVGELEAFRKRFPNDLEGDGELAVAKVNVQLGEQNFPEAWKELQKVPDGQTIKSDLLRKVKDGWQGQGQKHMEEGQFTTALKMFEDVLAVLPDEPRALAGRVCARVKELANDGKITDAQAALAKGANYLSSAQKDELREFIKNAEVNGQNPVRQALARAREELDRGDDGAPDADARYRAARTQYADALAAAGDAELKARAQLGLARAAARLGDWAQVRSALGTPEASSGPGQPVRKALALLADFPPPFQAWPAKRDGRSLLKGLVAIGSRKAVGGLLTGSRWEKDRLLELASQLFTRLHGEYLRGPGRAEAPALVEEMLTFDPSHVPTLLVKAESLYHADKFQDSSDTLARAEVLSDPRDREGLKPLKALVLAANPESTREQLAEASQLLKDLLRGPQPRRAELCRAYAAMARAHKEYLEAAATALAPLGQDPQVEPVYREVGRDYRTALLAGAAAGLEKEPLDKAGLELVLGDVRKARGYAFSDAGAQAEVAALTAFVEANIEQRNNQPAAAARKLLDAFGGGAVPEPLRGAKHRSWACAVLSAAAQDYRRKEGHPLQKPFAEEGARPAYEYLHQALALRGPTGSAGADGEPLEVPLVLAADQVGPAAEAGLVARLFQGVAQERAAALPAESGIPFLLAGARALARSAAGDDKARAVAAYRQALARTQEYRRQLRSLAAQVPATDVYQEIVGPAIRAAEQAAEARPTAANKDRLAELYHEKGQLVLQSPGRASWAVVLEVNDPLDVVAKDYAEALRLDGRKGQRARYRVSRAEARWKPYQERGHEKWNGMGRADRLRVTEALEEEAGQAVEESGESYPNAYYFRGLMRHYQALAEMGDASRGEQVVARLADAVRDYEKAVALAGKGQAPADFHNAAKEAYVLLSNYEPDRKDDHLAKAAVHRDEAERRGLPTTPEGWNARGNELEDQAWLKGKLECFPQAVAAFKRAIDGQSDVPRFYLGRGRAYYKWVAVGRGDPRHLIAARADLERAVRLRGGDRADEAEAAYWLGNVQRLRRDYAESARWFAHARKLIEDKKTDVKVWLLLATLDDAKAVVEEAQWLLEHQAAAGKQWDECRRRAGAIADDLAGKLDRKWDAAVLRGRMRVLQAAPKPEEALKEYLTVLGKDFPENVADVGPEHLKALCAWLDLFLDPNLATKLEGKLDPMPGAEKLAEVGEKAARLGDKLAQADLDLRPAVLALAARTHVEAASSGSGKEEKRHRRLAFEGFEKAVALTHPSEPNGWRWTKEAVAQCKTFMQIEADRKLAEDYYQRAVKLLPKPDEAKALPWREEVNELRKGLKDALDKRD